MFYCLLGSTGRCQSGVSWSCNQMVARTQTRMSLGPLQASLYPHMDSGTLHVALPQMAPAQWAHASTWWRGVPRMAVLKQPRRSCVVMLRSQMSPPILKCMGGDWITGALYLTCCWEVVLGWRWLTRSMTQRSVTLLQSSSPALPLSWLLPHEQPSLVPFLLWNQPTTD